MAGAIIENMSGRKLAYIGGFLMACQVLCFMVGAVFSPAPNNTEQHLGELPFLFVKVNFGAYLEESEQCRNLILAR